MHKIGLLSANYQVIDPDFLVPMPSQVNTLQGKWGYDDCIATLPAGPVYRVAEEEIKKERRRRRRQRQERLSRRYGYPLQHSW
jgi:hypothetical protein